jgi:hypothetical protein
VGDLIRQGNRAYAADCERGLIEGAGSVTEAGPSELKTVKLEIFVAQAIEVPTLERRKGWGSLR